MSAQHHSKAVAMASQLVVATSSSDSGVKISTTTTTTTTTSIHQHTIDPALALPLLQTSEWGLWSQNGEDGVLLWIFSELEMLDGTVAPRYYVEFGVEDGYECNTRILREQFHWNGLLMDGSNENSTLNLQKEFITAEDINSLFDKHRVPVDIDFLSVDIDFNDFWVLKSVLDLGKYNPKVIAVEFNSHIPPSEARTVKYNATQMWDGFSHFSGASAAAFDQLGAAKGYRLIYCESHGVNCFLVREDLVSDSPDGSSRPTVYDIHRPPNFFGKGLNYPEGVGEWVWPFSRREEL
jgi:hypothetical protein